MMFISFDYNSLVEVKRRLPNIEVSYLVNNVTSTIINNAKALGNNSGIDVKYANLTQQNVIDAHNAGLNVGAWTLSDDSNRNSLLALGVDSITTNSLSGELRYQNLSYQNSWVDNGSQNVTGYVTEIAPGKILLRFTVVAGKRTKGTVITTLPDWARTTTDIWVPATVRVDSGEDIVLGTCDITGYTGRGKVKVGFHWDKGSSKNWVAVDAVYYL